MSNRQKEGMDLQHFHMQVFVRICKEDKKRADEFLLKQKSEEENGKEERKIHKTKITHPLKKKKKVSSRKLGQRAKEKASFVCDYCQKEFPSLSELKQHVKIHTGKKDHQCNLCDYSCSNKGNLAKHIRCHLNERPFKCQEPNCGASFTQSTNLNRHQLVHNHQKNKRFSCSVCPFKTNEKGNLTRHVKNIHSDSRPFKCPHQNCEYTAKENYDLTGHLKIHSDEKNQICPDPNCGFKTKWNRALNVHLEIHSNGEKKYKCRFCDFASHHPGSLVLHVRRHTGETLFACQFCPYKSNSKSHLNRHMKTHGNALVINKQL